MLRYIARRILIMIPTIFAISVVSFIVIQLPPGDFLTSYIASLEAQGGKVDPAVLVSLRHTYGLDQPIYIQYLKWISGILLRGDFGASFLFKVPVSVLIWERIGLTIVLSLATEILTWLIAFPIGIYSAVRKYSIGDYFFTFLGFIGVAVPDFLLALVLMVGTYVVFGKSISGLFSPQFEGALWSWAKVGDFNEPFMDTYDHIRIGRNSLPDSYHAC